MKRIEILYRSLSGEKDIIDIEDGVMKTIPYK